ncbi:hypothetical protein HPB47_004118 [Ixodes persulcatus]|uniref:Uncharacterized protein n=1 Tax=Ixodes persulcatus TaxID=34615 RepID=A0AC60PHP8_IXOPE|nr:hypothetical protein HPB47_004118 [Ixodes persulcatus]
MAAAAAASRPRPFGLLSASSAVNREILVLLGSLCVLVGLATSSSHLRWTAAEDERGIGANQMLFECHVPSKWLALRRRFSPLKSIPRKSARVAEREALTGPELSAAASDDSERRTPFRGACVLRYAGTCSDFGEVLPPYLSQWGPRGAQSRPPRFRGSRSWSSPLLYA